MSEVRQRSSLGPRRELLLLMPVALVVLAALATFTLFAYRNAILVLLEEREVEAERLARQIASELSPFGHAPDLEPWRRRLPPGALLAVDDPELLVLPEPSTAQGPGQWFGQWLGTTVPERDHVTAIIYFDHQERSQALRLDLPVPSLASRLRGLAILAPVVLTASTAITLLVLVFLRRFLAPLDRMVARARDAGQVTGNQDEVAFLVETFERALEALATPPEVDDLKALEGTLVRSLKSGVLLCDAEGLVLSSNTLACQLLGLGGGELGRGVAEVLVSHPELSRVIVGAIRDGVAVERKECSIKTPGGERTLGMTVHPIRRDDDRLRGFLAIFADLTAIRARQEQERLVENLSQLGELTAGVAHEMRNSLATLRGFLTLVERDPEGGGSKHLVEIRHESDHLQRVLEDFLAFARPGSIRPQDVDLVRLARRTAADPALAGGEVEVRAEGELEIRGDPQLLERALRNLLHNAVEAQQAVRCETPVVLTLRPLDEGVEWLIEDHGAGISDEIRDRLFDPFFSARPGGVGMGLALTRRIVLLHSGRIELESREGGGARARVWIPVRAVTNGKGVTESSMLSNGPASFDLL